MSDDVVMDEDRAHAIERRRRKHRRRPFPGQLQEYAMTWHGLQLMHKSRGTTLLGASYVDSWVQGAPPMPSLSSTEPINLRKWQEDAVASLQIFKAALSEDEDHVVGVNIDVSDLAETSLVDVVQATRGPTMQVDTSGGLSTFDQQLMLLPDLGDLLRSMDEGTFDPSAMMTMATNEEPPSTIQGEGLMEMVPTVSPTAEMSREDVRLDLRNHLFDTWRLRLSTAKESLRSLSDLDSSLGGPSEAETRARLISQAEKDLLETDGRLKRKATSHPMTPSNPYPSPSAPPSSIDQPSTSQAAPITEENDVRVKEGELLVDLAVFFPSRSDNLMIDMRVLGSTLLSTVRDAIKCMAEINLGSSTAAGAISKRAYFFIEGVFYSYDPPLPPSQSAQDHADRPMDDDDDYDYDELDPPRSTTLPSAAGACHRRQGGLNAQASCQQDYVRPIIDLCCATSSRPTHFDIRSSFKPCLGKGSEELAPLSLQMKDTTIADLSVRLSNSPCYLFGHIGACEHLLMLRDARLFSPQADPPLVKHYPLMIVDKVARSAMNRRCEICDHNQAESIVHDDPLGPHSPYVSCQTCLSMLHMGHDRPSSMKAYPLPKV